MNSSSREAQRLWVKEGADERMPPVGCKVVTAKRRRFVPSRKC
jgi:hypothetical protein